MHVPLDFFGSHFRIAGDQVTRRREHPNDCNRSQREKQRTKTSALHKLTLARQALFAMKKGAWICSADILVCRIAGFPACEGKLFPLPTGMSAKQQAGMPALRERLFLTGFAIPSSS